MHVFDAVSHNPDEQSVSARHPTHKFDEESQTLPELQSVFERQVTHAPEVVSQSVDALQSRLVEQSPSVASVGTTHNPLEQVLPGQSPSWIQGLGRHWLGIEW